MKVSWQWLQEFVDLGSLDVDVQGLADALTRMGLAVEEVIELGDDSILDLEVTTNRPDCLNHLGVAREISAQFQIPLKLPNYSLPEKVNESASWSIQVTIENADLCPRYAAGVISGVKVAESPDWLKKRLDVLGQRTINNIVDATNYVLMEMGHPLHAFDYGKLKEHRIVVRQAKSGEGLTTLDGMKRQLDSSMLVICDARQPVALAGIMGGGETEISETTDTIVLESAYFHPGSVRSTAKALGIRSEASFRFERGADPEIPVKAWNRTCRLIQEIAGGVLEGVVVDEYPNPQSKEPVQLRQERIEALIGVSMDAEFVAQTLSYLEFGVSESGKNSWQVQVPSFRVDVQMEDDLVEEVARHYGYDQIESTYPDAAGVGSFHSTRGHDQILIRILEGLGFMEAFNYVFTNPSREKPFWGKTPSLAAITNPLTEEDKRREFRSEAGIVSKGRYYGTDLSRLLSDMNEDGVSGEVIYPNGIFHCFVSPDPAFQMTISRLYNDFYREVFGEHTDMFLPSAIVLTVNVNAASAEVERAAKMGYRSLSVPVSPSSTPYYKQAYDPLWATIERSGIPLSFHVFTPSEPRPVEKLQEEPGAAKVEDGTSLIFSVLGMAEAMSPLLMLIASGALDRHPDLKFVLVECGTGWLAWSLYAMDDVCKRRHMWQVPKLEMTPSEYFRR